jgi:Arc/MetJ family transcription regulator
MHILSGIVMRRDIISEGVFMRTTLVLPDTLIKEAMEITHISIKTDLIITALENLVQWEKIKNLADYFGKVDLGIDIDEMRSR